MAKTLFALSALCLALTACGGGGDDQNPEAVPAGAKVCELKQRPASLPFIPAVDVYDDARVATPEVRPAGDDLFAVRYPFAPGTLPYPLPGATITFYVRQFGYHASAETPLWGCVLQELAVDDKIAIRGGPRNQGGEFFVGVYAEVILDGKKVSSKWEGFWIEY